MEGYEAGCNSVYYTTHLISTNLQICLGIEIAVNVYFTIQTLVLITVYPSRKLYFSSVTNWIDIISILPFYLKLIAGDYLEQVRNLQTVFLNFRNVRVMFDILNSKPQPDRFQNLRYVRVMFDSLNSKPQPDRNISLPHPTPTRLEGSEFSVLSDSSVS